MNDFSALKRIGGRRVKGARKQPLTQTQWVEVAKALRGMLAAGHELHRVLLTTTRVAEADVAYRAEKAIQTLRSKIENLACEQHGSNFGMSLLYGDLWRNLDRVVSDADGNVSLPAGEAEAPNSSTERPQ